MSALGNKETIAKNITYYMEKFGKTQKELSEIVGVSQSTFCDWVKGKKYPRIDKIEIMANYFGILKSDLIEDRDQKKDNESALDQELKQWLSNATDDEKRALLTLLKSISTKKD